MKVRNLVLALMIVIFGITNVNANVFASQVDIDYTGTFPATIYYYLNQNATSVDVIIKDASDGSVVKTITVAAGVNGTLLGYNDVAWDGTNDAGVAVTTGLFTVLVTANDAVGSAGYEMISYDTGPDSYFWSPAGVGVNTDQTSPFFGMTYVTERTGGTSSRDGAELTARGVYLYDSFGRYYGQTYASAYAGGNVSVDWAAIAGGAPGGVTVGPDGRVYVYVLSENAEALQGGVVVSDEEFSAENFKTVLPFTGFAISDVIVVGTGDDRTMYTVEQTSDRCGADQDSNDDSAGYDSAIIKKYALGASDEAFSGTAEVVIPTETLPLPYRIEMDLEGFLYVVQNAWADTAEAANIYALSKWDISGATPSEVWHIGLNQAPVNRDSTINADSLRATRFSGLALDEANGILYTTRRANSKPFHNVMSYDMTTGALINSFASSQSVVDTGIVDLAGSGYSIRDVDVDAAGNVLIVNSSSEDFKIFSPEGANSYTTTSILQIDVTNGTTGVEMISSELPNEFTLNQNYPNPFNPITNINFSIPNSEFVTLTIYNSLGEEVSTLVSENLSAGSYDINFNASGFSSGLYFYKIKAGSYSVTKKMLLLK